MSIHPSLSASGSHKKQRSILKRTERLKIMLEKGQWKQGDSVFGLPKIKSIRIKIKKEKAAEKTETAAATAAAPVAEAKESASGKGAAATPKAQEKK